MKRILLCIGLALAGLDAEAELRALRLAVDEAPPVIDGRLDDAVWSRAPIHDRFVQFQPEDRRPARQRTTVQVLATSDALIVGIRAWDDAPGQIRAPLSRRDRITREQDFVSVVIDPVGLRRSAQFVRVSASGGIADGVFTAEDDVEDFAPDFDVQVATARLADGWSVELRWPLAALRYPRASNSPWRMMVARSIPREDDSVLDVSAAALDKRALSFIAELEPIEGLGQPDDRAFVQLRPELTARHADGSSRLSAGAELKWRPRADWVIDATLNPDFSQVELDAPQLAGNTRFALSVPEKRPFFLESTDIVGGSPAEGADENRGLAAFYSRAITDPAWGLRATWRGAGGEATALSLRDAGGGVILRPNAYGTAVHAQDGASQASYARGRLRLGGVDVGLLGSSREYGDRRYNRVAGADLGARLGDDYGQLRGHLLASTTTADFDDEGQVLHATAPRRGTRAWLGWQRRTDDWHHRIDAEQVTPGFANDNGFVSQAGYRRLDVMNIRRLPGRELAPLGEWSGFEAYEIELQLHLRRTETLRDERLAVRGGELVEQQLRPGFWFAAARNTGVWGHLGFDRQRARAGGELHAPRTVLLGFETNPNAGFTYLTAELEAGRRLDVEADRLGRGANLTMEARFRVPLPAGMGLELEQRLGQGFVRDDAAGRRAFTERQAQTLAVLHLDARHSLRAITQQTRYERQADLTLSAADDRGRQLSLVFQRRLGLNRITSVGLSRSRTSGSEPSSHSELFAKFVTAWPD